MSSKSIPTQFQILLSDLCIGESDIRKTPDNFFLVYKSLSDILTSKNIFDFLDSEDERLACDRFFDDWFLYAVPDDADYTYSLLKLREQEHDAKDGSPADGDTPGVTISFIAFDCHVLLHCLANPTDENKKKLNAEINRVVARRGQSHHKSLKKYFADPQSEGAYLVADLYPKHIATFAENGSLAVPEAYQKIVQQSISYKNAARFLRLPTFIAALNEKAGYVVCDNGKIYIRDTKAPNRFERAAILATHAGNTSVYSFAAEVEYHARFLTPLAKIKIPFFGKSIYDSAIRADMTVDDTEFEGPAPFYQDGSKIVRRQRELHREKEFTQKEMTFL